MHHHHNMGSDNKQDRRLKVVVMFPWLAHGHITPFLELAKALSHRHFISHLVSTPANLTSIANKIPQAYSAFIHLVELHLPSQNSPELPPHRHTTNGLPLNLHPALRKALRAAKPDFSNLVETLNPDLLIHDIIQPWAAAVASRLKIPSVAFSTSGAAAVSYFCHLGSRRGVEFPFPAIRLTAHELTMAFGDIESHRSEEKEYSDEDDGAAFRNDNGFMLVNSSREIEGKYIDYLSELITKTIIPIGSMVNQDPLIIKNNDDDDGDSDVIMDWLDEKDEFSSVFVSFGSEFFLNEQEIEEVAHGLELSGANFIWIIRFPNGAGPGRAHKALPRGFVERVGGRGMILEKWAPQARILSHSSVGGFVSHCGWNSLKEGLDLGVPIVAMPMHLDQPMNAKLVVEIGGGVEVKRGGDGRLCREEIAKVVEDVVFGTIGEGLRRRVGEKGRSVRLRSGVEVEEVALKLAQLCVEGGNFLHV
ncbi:hypothetical protein ABFX02_06G160700 [Erythranthe guttata]